MSTTKRTTSPYLPPLAEGNWHLIANEIADTGMPAIYRPVYYAMSRLMGGEASLDSATQADLAAESGTSISTVKRAVAWFSTNLGWISEQLGLNRANRYTRRVISDFRARAANLRMQRAAAKATEEAQAWRSRRAGMFAATQAQASASVAVSAPSEAGDVTHVPAPPLLTLDSSKRAILTAPTEPSFLKETISTPLPPSQEPWRSLGAAFRARLQEPTG